MDHTVPVHFAVYSRVEFQSDRMFLPANSQWLMQYENIATVRLQIIAGILGPIAAELLADRAAAFKSA